MDVSCLIEKLKKDCSDDVYIGVREKNKDAEKRYEDLFSVFVLALRMKSRELVKLSLSLIRRYQERGCRFEEDDWRSTVIGYAEFADVLETAERGEITKPEEITALFNPFLASPSDMLDIFRRIGEVNPSFQPVKELFEGLREIIQLVAIPCVMFPDAEELRMAVREYLLSWLDDFWSLFGENMEEFASSSFGFSSPLIEMTNCICDMTYDSSFDPSFDRLFVLLLKAVDRYGWKSEDFRWLDVIINNAVWHDEEHIFFTALNEAERRGERITFDAYPAGSPEILSAILERGELIPGTEKGRKAFFDVIRDYDVAPDVLNSILHPSYLEGEGNTALAVAAANPDFNPKKYFYLATPGSLDARMGLTPLGWACLRGDRKAADALLSLGADSRWKDESGNNILHYLLSLDGIDLESLTALVPPELFLEENREGKTPLHYYLTGEKVDFGEMYNGHRSLSSLSPIIDL